MFWNIFFNLCSSHNISPNAVCKTLGFSNATATHWKNGKIPSGESLSKIADYFNVTVDYLLNGNAEKTPPTEAEGAEGEITANDIIALLSDLPDDRVDQILDWIKVFVQIPEEKMDQALDYLEYLSKSK